MIKVFKLIAANPTALTVVLGILLLLWQAAFGSIHFSIQIFFAFGFFFFIGIPHRALDIWLDQEFHRRNNLTFKKPFFYLKYILSFVFLGTVWYYLPSASVFLFLCLSAWHIGETDLKQAPYKHVLWAWTRFIYGLFIMAWLFLMHSNESNILWAYISQQDFFTMQIWLYLSSINTFIVTGLGIWLVLLLLLVQTQQAIVFEGKKLVFLTAILLLTLWLPLLPSLGLFFGGWHAVNAFSAAHRYFLPKERSTYTAFQLWLHVMPLTLIAVAMLLGYAVLRSHFTNTQAVSYLYLLIHCTLLPHQLLVSQIQKGQES